VHKQRVRNAFQIATSRGLTTDGSFIVGSLDETADDIRQTIDFVNELITLGMGKFSYAIGTPFPGTLWWQVALERGLVSDDMHFEMLDTKRLIPGRPLLTAKDVKEDDVARFCEELENLRAKMDRGVAMSLS
jgi:radical SAM superfamily enzyme YgiQ (UPF0313 family)